MCALPICDGPGGEYFRSTVPSHTKAPSRTALETARMPFHRRQAVALTLAALTGLLAAAGSTSALADTWPAKPIRLVVPFPPGGGTDIIARETPQRVAKATGWTIVIDNKPGAGGNLGVDAVAKAPADGYTVVIGQTSNIAINPSLYSKLPYDPQKGLAPVRSEEHTSELQSH